MGNSESKERQLFIGIIMQILNRRVNNVKKTSVQSFSTFVQEQCPSFPEESSSPGFPSPPALHPGALSHEISCFVSTCVSSNNSFIRAQLRTLEAGPPSCNWWGLFFAETDILTTRGTQGPACLRMDQTQRPQLGPFCPWSPPDADNWPESPDR